MDGEDSKLLRKMAKGGGILVLGALASKAIMYFYRIFVAQELGPETYGILLQALAVYYIFVGFSNNGIAPWINRNVSKYIGKNKKNKIPEVMDTSLSIVIPLSIFFTSILLIFAETISTRFFDEPGLSIALKILAIAIPFEIIYNHGEALALGFKETKYVTYIDKIYRSLATLILTLVFIFAGYSIAGLALAQTIAIATSGILMLYLAHSKIFPFISKKIRFRKKEAKSLVNYSYPMYISGIVGRSTNWADTLVLGFFSTSASVGVYNAAMPTASLLTLFSSQMGSVLFPTVSELYAKGKKQKSIEFTSITLKWIYFVTFPALFLMILFPTKILNLIFGSQYTGGAVALSILGTSNFINAMTSYSGSFINSEEETQWNFYNTTAISILNVILNVLLIPGYDLGFIVIPELGLTGAAVATAISVTLGSLIAAIETYYLFGIQPFKITRFVPATLSTLISGGIIYFILQLSFKTVPKLALIPAFAAFGILYIIIFILSGGISENDSMIIRSIDNKLNTNFAELIKQIEKYTL